MNILVTLRRYHAVQSGQCMKYSDRKSLGVYFEARKKKTLSAKLKSMYLLQSPRRET